MKQLIEQISSSLGSDSLVREFAHDVRLGQLVAVGPMDVTGVKRLRLVLDWGKNRNTCDHADWVDPVLVRK